MLRMEREKDRFPLTVKERRSAEKEMERRDKMERAKKDRKKRSREGSLDDESAIDEERRSRKNDQIKKERGSNRSILLIEFKFRCHIHNEKK